MSTSAIIGFVIALAAAAIVIFPLGKALRRHPSPFYIAAIVLTVLYSWAVLTGVSLTGVRFLSVIMQKGYLASMFLLVVMFTGVLDETSSLRHRLQPIRGELSILSFIFILGHLVTYLPGYLPRLGMLLSSRTSIAASLIVAIVLTVVFCVLALMSLRVIRRRMDRRVWKAIQRASYLMMALLALHIGLVLGRSALSGEVGASTFTFFVYLVVLAVYAVLRIRKALRDRGRTA